MTDDLSARVSAICADLEADLRRQTVGTGVEVIRSGADVVLRMPASITFPVGSYAIQPQFQSTLREIAQTLRTVAVVSLDDALLVAPGLVAFGVLFAGLAAAVAIRRYLKV